MARGQNRMNRLTSIRMIKLCANSVAHPLTLMFQLSGSWCIFYPEEKSKYGSNPYEEW